MKLSAWKYVKNNKRVTGVMVLALALAFVAMYVIFVLMQTSAESFKPVMLKMPTRVSFADLSGKAYGLKGEDYETDEEYMAAYDSKQQELMDALKQKPGIEDAFYTQILNSKYQAVMGQYTFEVPLMEPERIPSFLKHMDAELIEGRLPAGDGEMLVDATIMKNSGYELGGWFMPDWYGEVFRIVGVIRSEYLISMGTPMGYTNSGFYIVVCNDENTTDLTGMLKEQGIELTEADTIWDAASYREAYKKDVQDTIDMVITGICLVVMIFLSILVMVAYVSFMRNRVNEYNLYSSIGYGRYEIYCMILKEMLILFLIGTCTGFLLSLLSAALLNELVILPRGLVGKVFYTDQILKILSVNLFIMGILQIPTLVCLSRIKTIDNIED
ncbi:MAG: ABC transporter permease [Lachnospiraceae bacterium]|nr:ABC transporter permease [Lachnospiraceae bacterium]